MKNNIKRALSCGFTGSNGKSKEVGFRCYKYSNKTEKPPICLENKLLMTLRYHRIKYQLIILLKEKKFTFSTCFIALTLKDLLDNTDVPHERRKDTMVFDPRVGFTKNGLWYSNSVIWGLVWKRKIYNYVKSGKDW